MQWFIWLVSLLLFAIFLWLSCLNAVEFWKRHMRKEKARSWVPLLGGGAGSLALLAIPTHGLKLWWWLPLLLDWGSLPGLFYTLAWHLFRAKPKID